MTARDTRVIRSATLMGYPQAAAAAGLDAGAMLERVGLSLSMMEDHDTLIPLDAFLELLALSSMESALPDFGLRAAAERGIPDLGAVTLLMREANTVEDALVIYGSHLPLHSDGATVRLDKRFHDPFVVVEVAGGSREKSVQATQFCVAGVFKKIEWLIGERYYPEMVSFSHNKPASSSIAPSLFRCQISYGQALSGIALDRHVLKRPVVTSPPFLKKLALQHLHLLASQSPISFATNVRRAVNRLLADGDCSSRTVASLFNIDRRTLNRRLRLEGENFSSILQSARFEIARQALQTTDCSLTELSYISGFQDLSAFSRWFSKSFGCTATDWRRQATRVRSGATPRDLQAVAPGLQSPTASHLRTSQVRELAPDRH